MRTIQMVSIRTGGAGARLTFQMYTTRLQLEVKHASRSSKEDMKIVICWASRPTVNNINHKQVPVCPLNCILM